MGLALARNGWQVSHRPVVLQGQPGAATFPRQEGCDSEPCSPWLWGQPELSPPAAGSPPLTPLHCTGWSRGCRLPAVPWQG